MATMRKTQEGSVQAGPPRARVEGEALRRRIAEKAYELFLKGGRRHGRDLDDWFEAERLLRQEPQVDVAKPLVRAPEARR